MPITGSIGAMRHPVEVQALAGSTTADSRGRSKKTYATVATIQASIVTLGGDELQQARSIEARATHRVGIWYNSRVTERTRLKFGNRYLHVRAVDDVDQLGRDMVLICEEVKN